MQNNYELMESMLANQAQIENYYMHSDWRVRYAAAVAIGESGNADFLEKLYEMLVFENTLPLYTQPPVLYFENSYDDTRMAEQLVYIKEVFKDEHTEHEYECWRCRGRVKQACLFAIAQIGEINTSLLELLHIYLQKPSEDYSIKAASARTLGFVGHSGSIPYLEMCVNIDEWCVQTESKKAIELIKARQAV